jgi:phage protein U
VHAARANLGPQGFALAWARGQELSLEATCALASTRTAFPAVAGSAEYAQIFGQVIDRASQPRALLDRVAL